MAHMLKPLTLLIPGSASLAGNNATMTNVDNLMRSWCLQQESGLVVLPHQWHIG